MSKKILKELFITSDESSYDYHYPDNEINNIKNSDFKINKNKYLFLTIEIIKTNQKICWLLPKVIIYLIFGTTLTIVTSLAIFSMPHPNFSNYIITNSIFHGSFIFSYIFFYIKNFKLVKKFKNIKRNIKNRDKQFEENKMQNVADEIINKNIKLLRKLKLENLNK